MVGSHGDKLMELMDEKTQIFIKELGDAYQEQANDVEFQQELSAWDVTLEDGLNTLEAENRQPKKILLNGLLVQDLN
jgi:hypothetical protein